MSLFFALRTSARYPILPPHTLGQPNFNHHPPSTILQPWPRTAFRAVLHSWSQTGERVWEESLASFTLCHVLDEEIGSPPGDAMTPHKEGDSYPAPSATSPWNSQNEHSRVERAHPRCSCSSPPRSIRTVPVFQGAHPPSPGPMQSASHTAPWPIPHPVK